MATAPDGDRKVALDAWLDGQEPDVARSIQRMIVAVDPEGDPAPHGRFKVYSLSELLEQDTSISWVVEGVFSKPSVNVIFGESGTKKTYLLLDCALHVAMGREWLGHSVEQCGVLFVDEENGVRRVGRRLQSLCKIHRADPDLPFAATDTAHVNLTRREDVDALGALLGERRPGLVIVDALVEVTGGADENAAGEMQPVFGALKELAEQHDCAIVVIHHSNKARGYRGSTVIKSSVDLMLEISSEPRSASIDVKSEKVRDGEYVSFSAAMQVDDAQGTVDFVPAGQGKARPKLNKAQKYAVRYIRDHGSSLLTDIEGHAEGCAPSAARKAVYDLTPAVLHRTDGGGPGEKATYGFAPGVDVEGLGVD